MSYLEFFGVVFGLVAVALSAKANIWSWPVGIANVVLAFFFYYQIQLYPDMVLQVFFFVTNLLGWWRWANPKPEEEDRKKELKVSRMEKKQFFFLSLVGLAGTVLFGQLASRLHLWLPSVFSLPSSFPYADSFILVMSIITTFMMVQKKIECWIIWIIIDVVATGLYFIKGAKFYSAEYFILTLLAAWGLWNWLKEYRLYAKA
ncbi:MAG: nicotinamide mononucleotide transporter [Bacteroidetes bacterium]|nr:nicotinamide mononucleotide transporter [Bacteroidota bacterium]MBS1539079.1 nicotinamide mononucleotide transporter [Bacteroidota bacterium]